MDTITTNSGTIFESVTTAFTAVASLMPRDTRSV